MPLSICNAICAIEITINWQKPRELKAFRLLLASRYVDGGILETSDDVNSVLISETFRICRTTRALERSFVCMNTADVKNMCIFSRDGTEL